MSSLRVVVVRYDDKIITDISADSFMILLTKKLLGELPDKRFGQDKRDAVMTAALNAAWKSLRTDLFSVGFKPATWVNE